MGATRRQGAGKLMRLSELLGRRVVTSSGESLGRIHDVRGEIVGGQLRITGLVAGKLGILERYGIGTHGSGGATRAKVHGHPVIPWSRVAHIGAVVTLADEG